MWRGHLPSQTMSRTLTLWFKRSQSNLSILFAHCFLFLPYGDIPSALSPSALSFYCVREGEGHRKITIIIEDPVAGWQCGPTVPRHLTPPPPCMQINSPSRSFQILPSAHNVFQWRSCWNAFVCVTRIKLTQSGHKLHFSCSFLSMCTFFPWPPYFSFLNASYDQNYL